MKKSLIILLVSGLTATVSAESLQQLSARYSCVDSWGRKIAEAEQTKANCMAVWTAQERVDYALQVQRGNTQSGSGSAGVTAGTHFINTPSGGYAVSHVGSTTYITRTSRR